MIVAFLIYFAFILLGLVIVLICYIACQDDLHTERERAKYIIKKHAVYADLAHWGEGPYLEIVWDNPAMEELSENYFYDAC